MISASRWFSRYVATSLIPSFTKKFNGDHLGENLKVIYSGKLPGRQTNALATAYNFLKSKKIQCYCKLSMLKKKNQDTEN